ncbi:hypothetical protein [Geobacter sp. SVR]|uniref:hypothetical protein n=1 Tax=Geobacter sp. SVR TaxID=2495594 RepID=UPI00143EF7F9|nr:hypothetical protein [Geobacter sp. SVR]BCS55903.1 C-type polyheme cytochrome OmcC [Geobacter sp. SVR]GCF84666.1 C-type polyheme cytochrome OmcB [Geobacter sp. SVR]
MRKKILVNVVPLLAMAFLLGGCGSSKKEGTEAESTTVQNAQKVGSDTCTNNCHALTQDVTMRGANDGRTIVSAWKSSVHFNQATNTEIVGCEDCHGGGSLHWGIGPMPYPVPDHKRCEQCHSDFSAFNTTAHANADQIPDRFFFQGSTGTSQASDHGVPEVVAGTTTPVTKNQHIEQCSVCHNSNQQFRYDSAGNLINSFNTFSGAIISIGNENRNDLPNPVVPCASCHDGHEVGHPATAGATTINVPVFRKSQIAGAGPWNAPTLRVMSSSTVVPARFNTTALICAACHTKGLYKYAKTPTHQENTYSQWSSSAHNDKVGVPWNEIAISSYPLNLFLPGTTAPGTCLKCHNGISSPAMMNPDPTTRRPAEPTIVWNQSTAVCVTCHDPHADGAGHTKNVRTPAVMTNYSGAGLGIVFGNVFLDTQPLPTNAGNASICIFCHQGRESGLSLFKDKLAAGRTITGNFKNNHYLGTAAMLWGANAYEYANKSYTANVPHQNTNCTGCHMANATEPVNLGGHTWRPNGASCNPCHSAITAATSLSLEPGEGFLAGGRATGNTTNFSGNPASVSIGSQIQDLQNYLLALLAVKGVFYDDTVNPYYFNVALTSPDGTADNHGSSNTFTAWTLPVYKAAFNLAIAAKANPSAPSSTTYVLNGAGVRVPTTSITLVPNKSAAVHNYKYVIQLLMDSYEDLYNNSTAGEITAAQNMINAGPTPLTLPAPATLLANRPAGTRQSVNYGAFVKGSPATYGGTYDARQ